MKFINKETGVKLEISESLFDSLCKYALEYYPSEFGGFLLGKYSTDYKKVYIEDVILPKKFKGTPTKFCRSVIGIEDVFKQAYYEKGLFYIGEWHSHPDGNSMFSNDDFRAMKQIVEEKTVLIKNPVLLILSVTNEKLDGYQFYFYKEEELKKYE